MLSGSFNVRKVCATNGSPPREVSNSGAGSGEISRGSSPKGARFLVCTGEPYTILTGFTGQVAREDGA
jgi:hypothetical protein